MHRVHINKCVLKVVRARADMEQSSRKFRWLGCRIKRSMIGQGMHSQRFHGAVFVSRELRFDMVVTTKASATQVLGTVFNPFDRLTSRN